MVKKAQIQIQETILVIFVFTVMLIVGLIVFYRYTAESIKNENIQHELDKFYNLIGIIPNKPEIKCSYLAEEKECIDAFKLLAYGTKEKDLGFMNITLFVAYPLDTRLKECKNTVENCNIYNIYSEIPESYTTVYRTSTPVSLYYPLVDNYKVGKLVLEYYL